MTYTTPLDGRVTYLTRSGARRAARRTLTGTNRKFVLCSMLQWRWNRAQTEYRQVTVWCWRLPDRHDRPEHIEE